MNSEREHELMSRARILALLQQEKNLLRMLPKLAEQELQDAQARLAAGSREREHLNALLRHDPKAIAAEEARLRQVDTDFERAVAVHNQEALAVPRDGLPSAAAEIAAREDIAALGAIQTEAVRFAALAAMGSSSEEQSAYRRALEELAPDVASAVSLAHAAVTLAWDVMQAERGDAIRRAEFAVADYISSERSAEYSYIDTFNPEGRPAADFHEQARLARTDMMKALAAISDDDANTVLARKQAVDHDRSTYPVAEIGEVRAYRAVLTGRNDPAQTVTDTERRLAADEIRHQVVSTAVSELGNAISWGYEPEFHEVFEAVKENPGIDAAAAIAIAQAITGTAYETREKALGAVEGKFYTQQTPPQQELARGGRS